MTSDTTERPGYASRGSSMGSDKVYERMESLDFRDSFKDDDPLDSRYHSPSTGMLPLYMTPARKAVVTKYKKYAIPVLCFFALWIAFWLGGRTARAPPSTLPWTSSSAVIGSPRLASLPRNTFTFSNGTAFTRPTDLKLIGIVFFGRRQFVNILDCYLRRNLAVNGGILDEIHLILHTNKEEDKTWIKKLIKRDGLEKQYILMEENTSGEDWTRWSTYTQLYKSYMTDPDAIYIKIDDDILYIEDHAIPELVRAVIEHPEAHSVQANIINNRWNYWHHYRSNAVFPYLMQNNPSEKWPSDSWRPSQLPTYSEQYPHITEGYNFTAKYFPYDKGHRWLPLDPLPTFAGAMARTPYGPFLPSPEGYADGHVVNWAVPAQSHYSLFENLERNSLHKYFYGNGQDGIHNLWYYRYNINMMAIRGSHLLLKPFWNGEYADLDVGDEYLLTMVIPRELNMPSLVATRAIAAHYSFHQDRIDLVKSDIMDRYRAYANEMVCGANNQKSFFGRRGNPHWSDHGPKKSSSETGHLKNDDDENIPDGPADIINDKTDPKARKATN